MQEVIIVGAGLSGLAAAYYLKKNGTGALVLEARERWGGRIETVKAAGNNTPVEMGATWFAEKHTHLMRLLKELELPFYKQYQQGVGVFETDAAQEAQWFHIPDAEEPSYRVAGGTSKLIDILAQHVGHDRIILGSPIVSVSEQKDHLEITTSKGEKHACRYLILTIPPFLILSQKITFDPALPGELVNVMGSTHTWMGESIKFAVEYESPFWRQEGYSGTIFSHAGIAVEMYDHSDFEETRFALKGFLSADASVLSKEERKLKVVEQLTRLLGERATDFLSYTERVWKEEIYTFSDYQKYIMPHQHNGHPLYSSTLMNGRLYLAGTETSPAFGGYMDGAVYSGTATAQRIPNKISEA
ncbi:FAD-dependent oxidoreductase [Pontibacter diazotrophicus]|uniref:FAD-dependent oxidoreductase n=1 Tax=Pontibacter diazotrophicus TaxID=1400979 RepID=A0A3D8KYW5_9BACT|nr:FAD-dependent oxidoreductase [Pontibacter diazotrophicus]RDV10370.1 FAD-dependent oxidoreductase [Pontibacter diazotrophicus]